MATSTEALRKVVAPVLQLGKIRQLNLQMERYGVASNTVMQDAEIKAAEHVSGCKLLLGMFALPNTCQVLDEVAAPQYASRVESDQRSSEWLRFYRLFSLGGTVGASVTAMTLTTDTFHELPSNQIAALAQTVAKPGILDEIFEFETPEEERELVEQLASTWSTLSGPLVDERTPLSLIRGYTAARHIAANAVIPIIP